MNTSIKLSFSVFTIILFLFISIGAQSFEGKVISKDISISIIALDELMFGNEESDEESYDEEAYDEEEESEEYSLDGPQIPIKIMEQYFSLSIEEMKKAVDKYRSEYGDEYMDQPLYEETSSEIFIKGLKMRVDTEDDGMKMSVLIDMESTDVKIIRWDQKIVMNMDYEKMKAQMDEAFGEYGIENDEVVHNEIHLESTGITKEINGFKCELYKGTNSENNYENVWLSKAIDDELIKSLSKMSETFAKLNSEVGSDTEFDFYVKNKLFPVLTKNFSSGEVILIEEILNVEKVAIDDSQFELPKGFQEMDMSQMMQQEFE